MAQSTSIATAVWAFCDECGKNIYEGDDCWVEGNRVDAMTFCCSCWSELPDCCPPSPDTRNVVIKGHRGPSKIQASHCKAADA